MSLFTVKYKLKGQWFFRRIRKVKGDSVLYTGTDLKAPNTITWPVPTRLIITHTEKRFEIPIEGTVFVFGPERYNVIRDKMSQEAGQQVL